MVKQDNQASISPANSVQKIAEGIYRLKISLAAGELSDLNHVNIYLVQGSHGWTLIDTGWKTARALDFLQQALAEIPAKITDIERIILSHAHPDHYGFAGELKKLLPLTPIMFHYWENLLVQTRYLDHSQGFKESDAYLEKHGFPEETVGDSGSTFRKIWDIVVPVKPDVFLTGGETISTGMFDLEIIWTPGHSPGHICVYEPRNQILFAGDYILPAITPNVSGSPVSGDDPLGAYLDSYNKIRYLPVKLVLPGHQDPFADFHGRMQAIVKLRGERSVEILTAISDQSLNAYQIAALITWTLEKKPWKEIPAIHQRMATGEVIAHMLHLRWQGKVRQIWKNSKIFYQKCSS
jgi:glyoxylase-like metal-dependent hydrolase (beta-lactamase superfamily II)